HAPVDHAPVDDEPSDGADAVAATADDGVEDDGAEAGDGELAGESDDVVDGTFNLDASALAWDDDTGDSRTADATGTDDTDDTTAGDQP
ncbi:MAG: hypothetical protein ACO3C1_05890, partial [Ilumatobacteraceae bacterium]